MFDMRLHSYNREVENSQLKLLHHYSKVFRRNRMRACCWRSAFTIAPVYGNRLLMKGIRQFTVLLPISWIYHWHDNVCRCAPL